MSSQSPHHPETPDERFDAALRSWGERAPRTTPEEAARRLADRLPERPAGWRPGWLRAVRFPEGLAGGAPWRGGTAGRPALWLAAAALVLALGLGLVLGPLGPFRDPRLPAEAAAPPAGVPVAPAGDVLVIELDPQTTLYMTLGGPLDLEGDLEGNLAAPAGRANEASTDPSGDPS